MNGWTASVNSILVPPRVTLAVAYVSGSAQSGYKWLIFTIDAILVPREPVLNTSVLLYNGKVPPNLITLSEPDGRLVIANPGSNCPAFS